MTEDRLYFIAKNGQPEVEVSRQMYIDEERNAGFYTKDGSNKPATGSFSTDRVSGRTVYR